MMATSLSYDVAIVGGGVIGLSVARELRRAGIERVVVLEREPAVGQGSSSRANGGFRAQFTTPINIQFSLYSIGELERLQEATAGLPGLHQTGYLLFTGNDDTAAGLERACELQRSLGVETEWLAPEDVARHAPLVRTEGLRAATFHARDGFLDPHGVVTALKQEAQGLGAAIMTGAAVETIDARDDGHFELGTAAGAIAATWVVNAAGAHARTIGALVGVDVPVDPIRRNLAFLPDPGDSPLIPMCVDLDTGVLVRREVHGGYLVAFSNPDDAPGWDTSVDPRFLEDVAQRIGNRFPDLDSIPVDPRHCWAGLYPETADHHAIIGVAADPARFVVCAGFGGHGIMHAPAAGKAVAELIADGVCTTFELHPLRPSRFAEGDLVVETAVL